MVRDEKLMAIPGFPRGVDDWWDIAFLDASGPNHDNRLRWKHFQLCRDLNPDGIIIVHDTNVDTWGGRHTGKEDVLPYIKDACQYNLEVGKGLSIFLP